MDALNTITTSMIAFRRSKTLAELAQQCRELNIELDTRDFEEGGDCVVVRSGKGPTKAFVWFNTVSGRFGGKTPDGTHFSSDDASLDGEPWFQALLAFFYTNNEEPQR